MGNGIDHAHAHAHSHAPGFEYNRELLLGTLYVLKVALPPPLFSVGLLGALDDDLFMVEVGAMEPSALRMDLVLALEPPKVFEDRVIPPVLL
jgi:hypothetical protein